MNRSAAIVHEEMREGLSSLATIATIAPLVGVFGTVIGIVNSFGAPAGERSTAIAFFTASLSDAIVPTALGLLVAMLSFCYYKYLTGRLASIDRDMENACLELQNQLSLLPVRSLACTTSALGCDVIFSRLSGRQTARRAPAVVWINGCSQRACDVGMVHPGGALLRNR